MFNKDNPNITGTDLETILGNLNELLKYDFTINEHFISALPDSNILSLTGSTVDGNSVDIIKLSAMHELIFMEFLAKLDSEKNTHIETLKKQFLESISVPANIKSKPKNAEKYIAQRTKEIESTVKNVFNLISKFLLEFNSSLTALNAYNYSVRSNTVKKINKNVFDGPENDYLNLSPTEIKNKLMKGGSDDYTLTMRETSKLDNTIVRNLKLFTKYKSDPIINITSALEAETEPKATTTQLAQLYPEFYQ